MPPRVQSWDPKRTNLESTYYCKTHDAGAFQLLHPCHHHASTWPLISQIQNEVSAHSCMAIRWRWAAHIIKSVPKQKLAGDGCNKFLKSLQILDSIKLSTRRLQLEQQFTKRAITLCKHQQYCKMSTWRSLCNIHRELIETLTMAIVLHLVIFDLCMILALFLMGPIDCILRCL